MVQQPPENDGGKWQEIESDVRVAFGQDLTHGRGGKVDSITASRSYAAELRGVRRVEEFRRPRGYRARVSSLPSGKDVQSDRAGRLAQSPIVSEDGRRFSGDGERQMKRIGRAKRNAFQRKKESLSLPVDCRHELEPAIQTPLQVIQNRSLQADDDRSSHGSFSPPAA